MVRDLIGEVVGLSPYEKRLLDMLKTGGASAEKRMYKFAKNRVSGLHRFCTHTNIFMIIAWNSQKSNEEERSSQRNLRKNSCQSSIGLNIMYMR